MMTEEQQTEKDVEGSGRDLILKYYPFKIAEHLYFFTLLLLCLLPVLLTFNLLSSFPDCSLFKLPGAPATERKCYAVTLLSNGPQTLQ
jgi:hypothetical protein